MELFKRSFFQDANTTHYSLSICIPRRANLAEYHVPVNADVPSLEALMIEEHDPHVNALGIKGVGEIGVTGSAGAVANAVWHATGVRLRRFPIRIEDLVMPPS